MTIVHKLKKSNDYSYFLKCPMCGSDFKETNTQKLLEDEKNKRLLENRSKQIEYYNEFGNKLYEFNFHCSKCVFNIVYSFEDIGVKKVN